MTKNLTSIRALAAVMLAISFLPACLKDTVKHTYTILTPVYKTPAEVRANIKSSTPQPVINPGKLFILGNYVYLNEIDKGVHIIDNTNPAAPVNKYFISIPGNIDLAVKGTTLYADLYTDMVTLNISDPANVSVKKITENAFPFRRYSNGFVADSTKIIVEWTRKDTTVIDESHRMNYRRGIMFDASVLNNVATTSASSATGISGSMARFTQINNYLYTVTDNALNAFNITQPNDPIFSGKVNIGWGIETVYPFENKLFIGSTTGMYIYEISDPARPKQVSIFRHATSCDPVISDGNYAYITLRGGTACRNNINVLDVVDVRNLSNPSLVKTYQLTNPKGLSKDGTTLFICDAEGLKVFDASNVNNIQLLQTVAITTPTDVIAYNNLALVVGKDGLYQYDYTNRNQLKLLSKITYK